MSSNTEPKSKNPELEAAELQKAKADAIAAEFDLLLKAEELKAKKEERKHKRWLNKNSRSTQLYNDSLEDFSFDVVKLREPVTDYGVYTVRQELRALAASHKKPRPITLEIYSPGGSILAGIDLFDDLRRYSQEGHEIRTIITGYAASMAGVLAQAGDHRAIRRNAYIHLHEGSGWASGKLSGQKEDVKFLEKLTFQMCKIYADRATEAGVETDAAELFKEMEYKELWFNAEEALERGFVDEIQG
jgi:ATP-dependent protease ClpP protease subunit